MIIVLNNKSNLNKDEYKSYLNELKKIEIKSQMILCPTYLNINNKYPNNIILGAQNVSSTADGAFTGEISAKQLKTFNVKYCLVGHSERREYQNESLNLIALKVRRLLEEDIIPILCIGETKKERDEGKVKNILEKEITSATANISEEEKNKLVIAYEPIWSIGTGKIPTNSEIAEVFSYIKTMMPNSKILYGGSVNVNNIDTLQKINIIDGYLLGGLSLKPSELEEFQRKLNN